MVRNGRLVLWMNGRKVATWVLSRGTHSLHYDPDWITSQAGRPISLSLPFSATGGMNESLLVERFFDNLLPDSKDVRDRIAAKYHLDSTDSFSLLTAIGRDCVGAIQLLPEGGEPGDPAATGRILSEAQVADLLRRIRTPRPARDDSDDIEIRISLAGAQEKTALLWKDDTWQMPLGSTPTTHILKLPLGLVGNAQADMRTSVENEWLCSKIVAAFGIDCARTAIARFEDQKALVVERFDRRWNQDGTRLFRLPQEDMCQALGEPNTRKYQADGGPGIARIMEVLEGSENSTKDKAVFFHAQMLFWMLAATDGHAKNFSLFLLPGGSFRLTPLYDILSVHPILGNEAGLFSPYKVRLAMGIKGASRIHYRINDITPSNWLRQAQTVGFPRESVIQFARQVADTCQGVFEAIGAGLPKGFPVDIAEKIFAGITAKAQALCLSGEFQVCRKAVPAARPTQKGQ